jgi:hypothetical protein
MTRRFGFVAGIAVIVLGAIFAISLASKVLVSRSPPIRGAFAYPWFPETWSAGTNYHPALGQYDSSNPTSEAADIEAMKWGGIQAGIYSWWGPGTPTDGRIPVILAAAAGKSFGVTVYYEPEGQGDPSSATIGSDLTYLAKYAADPSWLRAPNGRPVIFVYADAHDRCGMADRWAAAPGRSDWYIVLKVFAGYTGCASQPESWHQYGAASRTDHEGSYSYTISPGFWKAGESSPRLARDTTAWNAAVCGMQASGSQWQLITTFNEWGEGTAVEPATEWQSPSGYGTYLDILRSPSCASPSPSASP